ncbi:hypothetical protein [Runella sp.]|uniref:hypothetical protein n=1 Tax=Runella sp. TaxID=1960881 RepID=UPI003D1285D5
MVETQQNLAQTGISTFLSFGAKSVKPEILEKLLIGRQKTVDMLTQQATDIAEHGINAQLMLIGNRGMGKTHALRVLYHRIQPLVQSRKIVVAYFVEEAYDVASYLDFLVRIIKDFIRWYTAEAELLQQKLSILRETPSVRQEELAEQIVAEYVADKPLLILTENFDAILEALGKTGQAKLRSWLYRHNRISIMATAQALSPDLGREDRPFYQFFTTIYLKRLTYEDSLELLRTLAQTDHNQAVIDHLNGKGIGQVRAIHELVKGNHRLLVTFYEFLKADTLAKLSDIFLKTLNDLKPYYETYIRYLPPQQQKIVHYLALAVTPRNGTDISKDCFIDQKSLSKQLSDLQRSHLLEAYTDPADGRNKLYDLSEPLLRISLAIGEHTEGITPLFIDFLANWYNINELESQKERFWKLHLEESNEKLKQDYLYDYQAREKAIEKKTAFELETDQILMPIFEAYMDENYEEVIKLSTVVKNEFKTLKYFLYLGNSYIFYNENYGKAKEIYTQAAKYFPQSYTVWDNLARIFFIMDDFEEFLQMSEKAIKVGLNYYEMPEPKPPYRILLADIADNIVSVLQINKNWTVEKLLNCEDIIKNGYGMPDALKISYLMFQTYRRYVLEKDKRAIYELPKEQREFFLREIVKE